MQQGSIGAGQRRGLCSNSRAVLLLHVLPSVNDVRAFEMVCLAGVLYQQLTHGIARLSVCMRTSCNANARHAAMAAAAAWVNRSTN